MKKIALAALLCFTTSTQASIKLDSEISSYELTVASYYCLNKSTKEEYKSHFRLWFKDGLYSYLRISGMSYSDTIEKLNKDIKWTHHSEETCEDMFRLVSDLSK